MLGAFGQAPGSDVGAVPGLPGPWPLLPKCQSSAVTGNRHGRGARTSQTCDKAATWLQLEAALHSLRPTGLCETGALRWGWQLLGRRDGMVLLSWPSKVQGLKVHGASSELRKLRGRRVELGEVEEVLLAAAQLVVNFLGTLQDIPMPAPNKARGHFRGGCCPGASRSSTCSVLCAARTALSRLRNLAVPELVDAFPVPQVLPRTTYLEPCSRQDSSRQTAKKCPVRCCGVWEKIGCLLTWSQVR